MGLVLPSPVCVRFTSPERGGVPEGPCSSRMRESCPSTYTPKEALARLAFLQIDPCGMAPAIMSNLLGFTPRFNLLERTASPKALLGRAIGQMARHPA